MAKVLITGGTGTIGKRLSQLLQNRGHETVMVSRTAKEQLRIYGWDLKKRWIDPKAFEGVDYIMHLAGAGIADKPWTKERKQEIIDSRVVSSEVLAEHFTSTNTRLKGVLSASAIGYYPLVNDLPAQTEESDAGEGYLSKVCIAWEDSVNRFADIANFVSKVRIGLVLTPEGGALSKLIPPVKYYVGSPLGSGRQAMPWIHVDDVCNIFIHLMENELGGIYNATGPDKADNATFMQTLGDVMDRPLLLPNVPEFVIRLMVGEMADLVLKGPHVDSSKIQETGFHFDFPTLNAALSDLLYD